MSAVGPLRDRVILDCSPLMPGARLCQLLRQQGARVIKIESPERPDPVRELNSAAYADLNAGKEIAALNLAKAEDRERFGELVRSADGLVEGFRADTRRKLGLDAATLHALNPRLCIVSIVGYDPAGPHPERAGHDVNFEARTGMLSLIGGMPGLPFGALFGALEGALVMTAMLDAVARGADGGWRTVSIEQALLNAQSLVRAEFGATRIVPRHGETLYSGKYPCHRLYTSKDGHPIAVGAIEAKFWDRLCAVLGLSGLEGRQKSEGKEGKRVIALLQERFATRSWAEWASIFAAEDCCVEPVLDYSELRSNS